MRRDKTDTEAAFQYIYIYDIMQITLTSDDDEEETTTLITHAQQARSERQRPLAAKCSRRDLLPVATVTVRLFLNTATTQIEFSVLNIRFQFNSASLQI